MRSLIRIACALSLLVVAYSSGAQQALMRQPDISKTDIVFVYGGDLWTVPRTGGIARRLTANPSIKRFPKFSPDGKSIAFTGNYDGNTDVYVMPAVGGPPLRLTYHPSPSLVLGWTPDSKSILFRSGRTSYSYRFDKLFTVPLTGGMPTELAPPTGGLASFSPDGKSIAYNRIDREFATWKRYRGGEQSFISIYDLTNNHYSEIPHGPETDYYPMWRGDTIYFASDRTLTVNLFAYDLHTRALRQLTHYTDFDVEWPSLGPDAIVFQHGGRINVLSLATGDVTTVPIQVYSDMAQARPELRSVNTLIEDFAVSPSGVRAVFQARGDVFTVPAKHGDTRDITNSPGVRELHPAWSPDGRWVAYLSDRTGEYELYIRPQDGGGEETRITFDGRIWREQPVWSPDSKSLLFSDASRKLWIVTIAGKQPKLVDSDVTGYGNGSWSPDSKWIAYLQEQPNHFGAIRLYSTDQAKAFTISSGRYDDTDIAFDRNGKYLYLISNRTFTPSQIGPEINVNFQNTAGVYGLVLQSDTPSPLAPESDEEKPAPEPSKQPPGKPSPPKTDAPETPAAPVDSQGTQASKSQTAAAQGSSEEKPTTAPAVKPIKIDLDGLYERVFVIPVGSGSFTNLAAGDDRVFYLSGGAVKFYSLTDRSEKSIIAGVQGYDLNPAGTKLLYKAGDAYGIIDVAPNQAVGAGKLTVDLEMQTDPRAEWKEMFRDAWRMERDYYYDPNMHGLNWAGIYDRYAPLVNDAADRDDVTYLLGELVGELNTSHAYVLPTSPPGQLHVAVGLLGVDFEVAGGYYRIKKIYPGENWDPGRRSPLTDPGVNVKVGDYILAVNGVPLRTNVDPYSLFQDTVDKLVTLRVNSQPSDVGAHDVQVRPVASEQQLRYLDWVEGNRRKVEAATNGLVGYFQVPDTSGPGITEFGKGFYSQTDKNAVIVDERFNSGGFIPDFFAEKLGRKLLMMGTPRYGLSFQNPAAIYGPRVILANEWSGSGGDAFPYMFRKNGDGPIIGMRTWGGLVGINGFRPLMDGGGVTVPQFGLWSPQDEKWVAENHGIDPDIEVDNRPDLVHEGHDPQLERAIAYVLDEFKKYPPPHYHHPPYPVEKLPALPGTPPEPEGPAQPAPK